MGCVAKLYLFNLILNRYNYATNPWGCGYYNNPEKESVCAPCKIKQYMNKISGHLMDRIDLHIEVTPVGFEKLALKNYARLKKVQ